MKVGDRAFIIDSGHGIREVELVGTAEDGFIVRFVDTGGGIAVHRSSLFKPEEVKEEDVPFKCKKRIPSLGGGGVKVGDKAYLLEGGQIEVVELAAEVIEFFFGSRY